MSLQEIDLLKPLRKLLLVDGFDMVVDLQKSYGSWIYDSKSDSKYLDFFSFFASAPVGFNHPDAINDQEFQKHLSMAALNKVSNSDFYTEEYISFVEAFERIVVPDEFIHAFFISGGALAVENTLKASFDWKVRSNMGRGLPGELGSQVLHFKQAFHGRTGYTLSLTNTADPRKHMYFPKFDWPRVENPKITFPVEEHLEAIIASEKRSIEQIHDAFSQRQNDIAAIIIEPIQGEGGDNHFRKEYLMELRKIANDNEAMLIFDEVQTGIGMTGKMWAFEHYDVIPDMIAFGKKMQTCGFIATSRIDSVENNVFQESSRINSTWGGNLVDFVRSSKYLEIIEKYNLVENANRTGNHLLERLEEIAENSDRKMTNIRGKGLFVAFDLPTPKDRDMVKNKIYKENVIVLASGERSIRFRPPLTILEEEIDIGMEALNKVIK
jgi:L-lysine 6-transaminase